MTKEELKQYIDDNVYENQDGDITGESLNAVLKAIVDDGGTEVEANPTGEATETLGKLKIGETIYTAPQGPQGEPGEDGQDGQPGAPGPANTLSIGMVTDGEQAAASITGDAPNQTLNLTLPDGKSAYQLYVDGGGTLTQEQWLASLKANIGAFQFITPTDTTAEAALTTIGSTYASAIGGVLPTQSTLSVILLMNDSNNTKTMMIATQDDGNSGFEFVYAGDLQSAIPSNVLTENDIDDTHLENPVANSVAKASDGKDLKNILVGYEAEVLNEDVESQSHSGQFIRVIGSPATAEPYSKTGSVYFECEFPQTQYAKIEFLGFHSTSDAGNCGFAFGHYENSTFVVDYAERFGNKDNKIDNVVYSFDLQTLLEEHAGITHFRTTVKYSDLNTVLGSFYCRFITGYTVKEDIDNLAERLDEVEEAVEVIPQLQEDVDAIEATKLMKITIDSNQNIMVRTALSQEKDVAVTLYRNMKEGRVNNITFNSVYVGDKGMADETLLSSSNKANDFSDSTPPFSTSNFGYMYANHGWAIPAFTVTSGSVTDADLNSEWIDEVHDNRSYYIGKIDGSVVYLIPKITGSDGNQSPSLDWWNDPSSERPSTLTNASDNTRQITGSSSRYDLAVQVIKTTRYIADCVEFFVDEESGETTLYCNAFTVCQDIDCKAPWSITTPSDWFEDVVPFPQDSNVFSMQRSYNFSGSSCTVNVSVNCEQPIKIARYFAVQPQMPVQSGDFNSTTFFPKAKKSALLDMGISSNSTDTDDLTIYRDTDNLYNVDDMTERVVTVLKDTNNIYLIGVASGLSLDKGMTVSAIRNSQVVENSSHAENTWVLTWNTSSSARNKCYFQQFKARGEGEGWQSGMLNTDFVKDFVTYFAWFDPNANLDQQVYWVKEGDYWLIYAHAQTLTGKIAVNLPPLFEGMTVIDTIEKTDGATLLTSVVAGGRIYVKYEANANGQANFITMKLK